MRSVEVEPKAIMITTDYYKNMRFQWELYRIGKNGGKTKFGKIIIIIIMFGYCVIVHVAKSWLNISHAMCL